MTDTAVAAHSQATDAQNVPHPPVFRKGRLAPGLDQEVGPEALHLELGIDELAKPIDGLSRDKGQRQGVEDPAVLFDDLNARSELRSEHRIRHVEDTARRGTDDDLRRIVASWVHERRTIGAHLRALTKRQPGEATGHDFRPDEGPTAVTGQAVPGDICFGELLETSTNFARLSTAGQSLPPVVRKTDNNRIPCYYSQPGTSSSEPTGAFPKEIMSDPMPETLPKPFSITLNARWPDMDFNQHMRNAAYLGASEDCRMTFLARSGFTMDSFRNRKIGPVVLEDRLFYKKELRLLEAFHVDLALAGITPDARRMKVRNTFRRESDGVEAAVVESIVLWFDLEARRPIVPPDDLKNLWLSLARTPDFELYPAEASRKQG